MAYGFFTIRGMARGTGSPSLARIGVYMYYLKEMGYLMISPTHLWDRNTDVEYVADEGWYYVDQGDHFELMPGEN